MDYKVNERADPEEGRLLISLAENEMPGLMALRKRLSPSKPLKGARIAGSLHATVQTAVLIETLIDLGAELRWSSCNVLSTHDAATYALAKKGIPIFAWKGETEVEYEWCIEQTLKFDVNLLLDDGGDLTNYVHDKRPDLLPKIKGVSEETTTGVRNLRRREKNHTLKIPAMNINDALTKSAFDNYYGSRESFLDGIKHALNTMISGKIACVAGFGDVGRGCADSLKNLGARVYIIEADPVRAYHALAQGYNVLTAEEIAPLADLFVTATGCIDVIRPEHIDKMKNQAILCNMGHFDKEIDIAYIKDNFHAHPIHEGAVLYKRGDKSLVVLADGRLVNLGCGQGHPSFVMSNSFSCQILAQIELYTKKYLIAVHPFPRALDDEVARLHVDALGGKLTPLTPAQKDYLLL